MDACRRETNSSFMKWVLVHSLDSLSSKWLFMRMLKRETLLTSLTAKQVTLKSLRNKHDGIKQIVASKASGPRGGSRLKTQGHAGVSLRRSGSASHSPGDPWRPGRRHPAKASCCRAPRSSTTRYLLLPRQDNGSISPRRSDCAQDWYCFDHSSFKEIVLVVRSFPIYNPCL